MMSYVSYKGIKKIGGLFETVFYQKNTLGLQNPNVWDDITEQPHPKVGVLTPAESWWEFKGEWDLLFKGVPLELSELRAKHEALKIGGGLLIPAEVVEEKGGFFLFKTGASTPEEMIKKSHRIYDGISNDRKERRKRAIEMAQKIWGIVPQIRGIKPIPGTGVWKIEGYNPQVKEIIPPMAIKGGEKVIVTGILEMATALRKDSDESFLIDCIKRLVREKPRLSHH